MFAFRVRARNTSVWYINDDGSMPGRASAFTTTCSAADYRKELRISEDQDYIPFAVIDAGGGARRLLRLGVEHRADGDFGSITRRPAPG